MRRYATLSCCLLACLLVCFTGSSRAQNVAPGATQVAIPISNADLDALMEAALAAQSVASFCTLECPEVITCEIAQQLLQSLSDAQYFLERLKEWTEKARLQHFDHFVSLASQEIISDENTANVQLAIGLHQFLHDFGSSMLDVASVIGSARDFAKDAASGDLGDMSPSDLLEQLDSAYEGLKDLESGMDTLSSSASGGDATGTPLADATTEIFGADINNVKSYVSDAKSVLIEGIEEGKIDWAAIGQSLGRFAKGISAQELNERQQRYLALQAGQDAEALARARARLDTQIADARKWKSVDTYNAVTAARESITPCLTELCGSSTFSRAMQARVDAAIFAALNGRDPLESVGWGEVLRALNPFIEPLTERIRKLPRVENYCPIADEDGLGDVNYRLDFGDNNCLLSLKPMIGNFRRALDSDATTEEFTFELPGACAGSHIDRWSLNSFGVYNNSRNGRRWSQLPQTNSAFQTASRRTNSERRDQWGLTRIGLDGGIENNGITAAQPETTLVAIIDSGIDLQHPDLQGVMWSNADEVPDNNLDDDDNGMVDDVHGWNFVNANDDTQDNNGHGTVVGGIIGATANNQLGISGVNPWARLMAIKVTDFVGEGNDADVAGAVSYATDMGARVINISLGGYDFSQAEQAAVDYAIRKGALVVVAAGNQNIDASGFWPAGLEGVITVAATNSSDQRAAYSNWGRQVDIAAPGSDILSLRSRFTDLMFFADADYVPGDNIVGDGRLLYNASGTSFAAPFVSGVASLLFSTRPDLSAEEVRRMILHSAQDIEIPGVDSLTGYGLLDAKAALAAEPTYYVDAAIATVQPVQRDGNVVIQVIGVADANRFESAVIALGEGNAPDRWISIGKPIEAPVHNSLLLEFDASQLQDASTWTLRLSVNDQAGNTREARYSLTLN